MSGAELTAGEAARLAGRSVAQIQRLCASGRLRARKPGRDWIINTQSLNEYIKSNPRPGIKKGQKLGPRTKAG